MREEACSGPYAAHFGVRRSIPYRRLLLGKGFGSAAGTPFPVPRLLNGNSLALSSANLLPSTALTWQLAIPE